jgi:subtilisin family serine protease
MRRGLAVLAVLVLAGSTSTAWAQGGGSDTDVPGLEWPLQTFGVSQIRALPGGHGTGVVVAVVDSGVDASQPDLAGALVPGADFSGGQSLSAPGSDTSDMDTSEAHGTSMATIIAGRSHQENGQVAGMIGLADQAKIMPVRVGSGQGNGDQDQDQAIANGIIWAAQHGARVINLSIGSPGEGTVLQPAIRQAEDDNVVVVAAAGNDGNNSDPVVYPAAFPGVVAVSGVEPNGSLWSGSETGSYIALAGPGDQVETAGPGDYGKAYGTSDAAAYVSAEAALVIAAHPDWTAGQVIRAMISTATPGPGQSPGTRSDQYGYGIMNPYGALKAPTPSQTTNPLLATATTQPVTNPPASGPTQNAAVSGGSQPTAPPAATSSGSSSNTGVIIGGVAGAVVLLAIIITLIAVNSSRRRRAVMPTGPGGFGPPPNPGPGMPYQGPNPPPAGGYPGGPFPPNGQPPQGPGPTSYPPGRR